MARRAEVNVHITGDATDVDRAFDRVGDSAKAMANDVGKSTRDMGEGLDRVGEGADDFERKTIGLRDAVTGTGDVLKGFKEGDMTLVLTGFADLASSVANFAGPVIKSVLTRLGILTASTAAQTGATTAAAGAQTGLNAALLANPIGLVVIAIAALVGGFILAWKNSETFRKVVTASFNAVKDAAGAVLEAIGSVVRAFRDLWNSTVGGKGFTIGGVDLPGPFDIPEVNVRIPRLHSGGVVGGVPGSDQLRVLQAGETVLPRGQSATGGGVSIVVQGSVITERDLGRIVADALRQNKLIGVT